MLNKYKIKLLYFYLIYQKIIFIDLKLIYKLIEKTLKFIKNK